MVNAMQETALRVLGLPVGKKTGQMAMKTEMRVKTKR
jgi:hypothetical protein